MSEFREKLADSQLNLDHPVWVEDTNFDLDRRLQRIGLPTPGGRKELAETCAHIASPPLDRSQPLWEMWVIEDAADADVHEGGRLTVMTKVHHAAVDGVTGANLLAQLCSVEPNAPPPNPARYGRFSLGLSGKTSESRTACAITRTNAARVFSAHRNIRMYRT